jgi:hypothetical protein
MATLFVWLEALAGLHALYEMVTAGADYAAAFARHRQSPALAIEAERAQALFSTYSDAEVEDLLRRIGGVPRSLH